MPTLPAAKPANVCWMWMKSCCRAVVLGFDTKHGFGMSRFVMKEAGKIHKGRARPFLISSGTTPWWPILQVLGTMVFFMFNLVGLAHSAGWGNLRHGKRCLEMHSNPDRPLGLDSCMIWWNDVWLFVKFLSNPFDFWFGNSAQTVRIRVDRGTLRQANHSGFCVITKPGTASNWQLKYRIYQPKAVWFKLPWVQIPTIIAIMI